MAKTFNELSIELKDYILDCLSDPRAKVKVKPLEYNRLNVYMDPSREETPHIIVSLGIVEAIFDIKTGKKISGGLGPDEKYVVKWLEHSITQEKLRATWLAKERLRQKARPPKPESKFR